MEIDNTTNSEITRQIIPNRIFIVPYRNRLEQKFFYSKQMSFILEDETDYEIYFAHQCDNRNFNRGATKNIGFLAMKEKYPDDYKNITFIFNDVDTLPFNKIFDYQTTKGIVKHYYGFEYALGGIVVIKGDDFEKINGFPNFWGWGNEDKILQIRCEQNRVRIDRSQFYKIGSPEILQLFDGVKRLITPKEYYLGNNDSGIDGLSSITRLTFSIDKESLNTNDNKYVVDNNRISIINILSFLTGIGYEQNAYYEYDLRDPTNKILNPNNKPTNQRVVKTEDWKNIGYQPKQQQQQQQKQQLRTQSVPLQVPQHINKYSAEYARYVGAKPRASTSANIYLGGVRRF